MLKRTWADPVWSKVIAGVILAAGGSATAYLLNGWPLPLAIAWACVVGIFALVALALVPSTSLARQAWAERRRARRVRLGSRDRTLALLKAVKPLLEQGHASNVNGIFGTLIEHKYMDAHAVQMSVIALSLLEARRRDLDTLAAKTNEVELINGLREFLQAHIQVCNTIVMAIAPALAEKHGPVHARDSIGRTWKAMASKVESLRHEFQHLVYAVKVLDEDAPIHDHLDSIVMV